AELIKKSNVMGFGAAARNEHDYDVMKEKILEETKKVLKPEFVNRLDDLIVFHTLGRPELLQIIDLEIGKVTERIKQKDIKLVLDETAKDFLIEKGYDPQYGARPMRRAVERYLEDPMAEEILRGHIKPGDSAKVIAENGKLTFTVPKPATGEPASAA